MPFYLIWKALPFVTVVSFTFSSSIVEFKLHLKFKSGAYDNPRQIQYKGGHIYNPIFCFENQIRILGLVTKLNMKRNL